MKTEGANGCRSSLHASQVMTFLDGKSSLNSADKLA
jgi:hypothetical protein